jgi:hypothetical protein
VWLGRFRRRLVCEIAVDGDVALMCRSSQGLGKSRNSEGLSEIRKERRDRQS